MTAPRRRPRHPTAEEKAALEATAYHEAGHALVAYYWGGDVGGISTEPSTGGVQGVAQISVGRPEDALAVALAGPIAEGLFTGDDECWWGAATDLLKAKVIANQIADGYENESEAYFVLAATQMKRFLARQIPQVALRLIVDELLIRRTLGKRRARLLIKQAVAQAERAAANDPRCVASRPDGWPCGQPASVFDPCRDGLVCPAHAPTEEVDCGQRNEVRMPPVCASRRRLRER